MSRCKATTQSGTRCKREALEGTEHCKIHTPKGNELSLTEELFCSIYASTPGISAFKAWKMSHPESKAVDSTIYPKACVLMGKDKIKARISELKEKYKDELAERAIWTKEMAIASLKRVIDHPDKASDITGAVKGLNELCGINEDTGNLTAIVMPQEIIIKPVSSNNKSDGDNK